MKTDLKNPSVQNIVECKYKVINYLLGRFSKPLKCAEEAIELKVNCTCTPKSLGCF